MAREDPFLSQDSKESILKQNMAVRLIFMCCLKIRTTLLLYMVYYVGGTVPSLVMLTCAFIGHILKGMYLRKRYGTSLS